MTRITFYEPEGGYTTKVVSDVLAVVAWPVDRQQVNTWTRLELAIAYDWAIREHLHASDNPSVRRRERPSFLEERARLCFTGCELLARPGLQLEAMREREL